MGTGCLYGSGIATGILIRRNGSMSTGSILSQSQVGRSADRRQPIVSLFDQIRGFNWSLRLLGEHIDIANTEVIAIAISITPNSKPSKM
jgi:hypothetical protein